MQDSAIPVRASERIQSLDVLRGFALLGILVMNIQSFAMPGAAYMNPTAYGDFTGVNRWVWILSHVLADQKFMAIFSMLFGAGVCLFADRAVAKQGRSAFLHYRRTFWLLVFGLLHAHLLWYGDVLVPYAVSALLVYLFRNRSPRTLVISGALFLAVPFALNLMMSGSLDSMPAADVTDMRGGWAPDAAAIAAELRDYRGGWSDQIQRRSETAFFFETVLMLMYFMWRSTGMMLIGMALYRSGVMSGDRSPSYYAAMAAAGGTVGLSLIAYGTYRNFAADFAFEYSMFAGGLWNYVGSIGLGIAYVAGVLLLLKRGVCRALTRLLATFGRMAFTNYLLQTVFCTLIFYGHGFGWFGSVERWQQLVVVILVWMVLIAGSSWWLARFRFGPMEWLWRSLTYWRLHPLRLDRSGELGENVVK